MVSLIIAALLICTAGPVFTEGEKTAPSLDDTVTAAVNTDGQVRFIETEPESDVKNIRFNFMDTRAQAYNWRFPYSDSFDNLYMYGYDKPTTEDSLSVIIGMKKIDDFTMIAAVACGQGYGKEWAGNIMFYIFLLALRGTIRSKKPARLLIAGFILVCAGLSAVYYHRLAISAFSVPNMIAFFVMVTLLSVLAAMTFRRGSMFRRIKQKNSAA